MQFLCSASYLAKAYDMIAALSPGNSGMAYSLLGSLAANDGEWLENHPRLPFFRRNSKLHLDIPDLHYPDRFGASFQIYLEIYRIRRGLQPYPARRLSDPQLPDIISVLTILEALLMDPPPSRAEREIRYHAVFDFLRRYRRQIQEDPRFAVGLCPQYSDIQDCLYRIDRLKRDEDWFIVQDRMRRFDFELPAICT